MIQPLRKRAKDGNVYSRPPEIESAIEALVKLSAKEIVERSRISDSKSQGYVKSECLLYFVRNPGHLNDEMLHRDLVYELRQRVLRSTRVQKKRSTGTGRVGENVVDVEVRDAVLGEFQELLCLDRKEYDERLDYYECRFNSALHRLRGSKGPSIREKARRHTSLTPMEESNDSISIDDLEIALKSAKKAGDEGEIDFLYRLKLREAINTLPLKERQVIELLYWEGIPIDSKGEKNSTIVKMLGCSEKTVRNRRDRGLELLRDALREVDDQ